MSSSGGWNSAIDSDVRSFSAQRTAARRPGRSTPAQSFRGGRQHLEGQPQGGGRSAGAGALQRDLTQVQFVGGEIGVRGVVLVVPDTCGSLNSTAPHP